MFNLLSVFYEFEKELIRERTVKALESKRKRGIIDGRPKISSLKIKRALEEHKNTDMKVEDILKTYGIGKSTFYRYLKLSKKEDFSKNI